MTNVDDMARIAAALRAFIRGEVVEGADLRRYSRWRIGGPARLLVSPATRQEAMQVLREISKLDCPKLVIGDGSNLLFDSRGFDGIVVRIGAPMSGMRIEGDVVWAEAGIWVPCFVRAVGAAGLAGAQHAIGIPGTLGGLILMNGGSQRKGIGSNLVSLRCCDMRGELREISAAECRFSYRYSALQDEPLVLLDATLRFDPGDRVALRREMIAIMQERRRKFPKNLPNCGSVFLSNPAMYDRIGAPGYAIEKVGLKGTRRGGAEISPLHANFVVNLGGAASGDVLWLIREARQRVFEATGFLMDCEVRHVAPDGRMRMAHEAADEFAEDEGSARPVPG
jgi:UDP-N-acetylmuramate dehydrogenase